ncbi:MAG: 50S ribosomal protein L21 [Oscillospiraceae bacterium]|nr:50S ribosomal protein L21 [Oscillospiraceae bacterium]
MFAVIETGGKQYKVSVGDVIFVEKLEGEANSEVVFDKIVSVSKRAGSMSVGTPYVKNVTVTGTLVKTGKGKKITVLTYRPKKDSKRKLGHRQPYSQVRIESINV